MQFQTTEPPDRNWQQWHQLATLAKNRQSDPERVVLVCFYLVEAQPMQKTLKALRVDAHA
jgi:hypothetical protein